MNDNETESTTRRRLLATVGTAGAASVAGCGFQAPQADDGSDAPAESPTAQVDGLERYPRVRVGSVDELSEGDVESFAYPLDGTENFLTRIPGEAWGGVGPEGGIVGFSGLCTHMGCSVQGQVSPEREVAGPCPCHYTTFDLSMGGLVVSGAATTDLPQIRLDVEDGDVYATGVDGLVYGRRNNLRDGTPVEAATEE
ncbi:arsenate reductase (azurin) small subunit [Halorubrum sp. BOL3-1]|uniref:arsenate reductase (azurin) small subunit n=1 Tax=Halorubrum sp. BOL3-1 TaxID=2497325 RepID=UPI001004FD30|nr:arsenate reductase (azurin) small subunit [Halorubrum sp. BOL3-1]QAU14253.1 arsenate reductase (azurin) small subunit [Halorubrum sp. BOL3-1]